jgi:hypothetical protein
VRDFLGRLKRWLAMRLIFHLARWAASGGKTVANRAEFTMELARLELLVRFRRPKEPDGWAREEVVRMLETVRAAERRMRWKAPDAGAPREGQLVVDGEPVPVLYWGEYPELTDSPSMEIVERARLVVGVDAEGTSRVLKDRQPGSVRLV